MDERTQHLLSEALQWHESCERTVADVHGEADVLRRLIDIEETSWSESPLEPENRALTYRHLLSLLDNTDLLERRYLECKQDYLKSIVAQRYAEVLADISDMDRLTQLAEQVNHDLRPFVILRLQEALHKALAGITAENIPNWFVRLLLQPWEVRNFLSQPSCAALVQKIKELKPS